MALTTEQLYQVRIWIPWTSVTDADLHARYDAIGETEIWHLVREQLRRQLLIAMATPAQFTIVGEYGQNTAENIKLMRDALVLVEAEINAAAGGLGTASLVRPDPYRAGRTASEPVQSGFTRLL